VGRKKKILIWGIFGCAAAALAWLAAEAPAPQPETKSVARTPAEAKPAPNPFAVPERDGLNRPRGDLFATIAPPPPPPAKREAQAKVEPPPVVAAPEPPPMPYRVAGQVVHEGPPRIVLARDDRVFFVAEGDLLEGGYRIVVPEGTPGELVYTPLDARSHLPALAAAAPNPANASRTKPMPLDAAQSRPVQLRWEGPASVQAGSEFEVALKMTSDRPVRGTPLQLTYDAKLLEPVSVRAGDFFVDGSFTYRVNPGSIFVGAFGKGEVAADAEFVVVTFKPIRAGATAELSLSSLVLQGSSGARVHEPLGAFRTAISK